MRRTQTLAGTVRKPIALQRQRGMRTVSLNKALPRLQRGLVMQPYCNCYTSRHDTPTCADALHHTRWRTRAPSRTRTDREAENTSRSRPGTTSPLSAPCATGCNAPYALINFPNFYASQVAIRSPDQRPGSMIRRPHISDHH